MVAGGDEARGARLVAHLEQAGYPRCHPAVLQKASIFLDTAGEDIRGRLFLTCDASGTEFCLRPELTVPVCLEYLRSPLAGQSARYSYFGPVFRIRSQTSGEFTQAGLESFGRSDHAAADAEILALALEAVASAGGPKLTVTLGDAGLFAAMIRTLGIAPVWQRRILRGHSRGQKLATILDTAATADAADHSGVLAALEGTDKKGARALVEDLLAIAGISTVGGRTAGEIADRFLEQAALKVDGGFPPDRREILERFLAIAGEPDNALVQLRQLASEAHLDLGGVLEELDDRLGFISAHGIDVSSLHFSAAFARKLDYYTGFVFEARAAATPGARPIIGGGRYDRLLASLNGGHVVPAVGAAIWMDRLMEDAI